MKRRTNKNRLSIETEKHLCQFLVSPYRYSGLRAYKSKYNLTFPEPTKKVSGRLEYLKKIYNTSFADFAALCKVYDINSTDSVHSYRENNPPSNSLNKSISSTSTFKNPYRSLSKMNINGPSFDEAMKSHQICLSEDLDSLNDNGMIFFRDDNVEIGDSMNSILTVYQPLFDARDLDLIDLYVHPDDKRVLHHVYPKVPSFMYRDHDKVHKLERSEENPEVYWFTKKKHKRLAFKIVEDNDMKLETSEYRLPFELSTARVDSIENSSTKLMKNYRTFTVKVDENIYHTVAYVFWKIIIEGKTANFSGSTNPVKRNLHADAKELEERMSSAFAKMDVNSS